MGFSGDRAQSSGHASAVVRRHACLVCVWWRRLVGNSTDRHLCAAGLVLCVAGPCCGISVCRCNAGSLRRQQSPLAACLDLPGRSWALVRDASPWGWGAGDVCMRRHRSSGRLRGGSQRAEEHNTEAGVSPMRAPPLEICARVCWRIALVSLRLAAGRGHLQHGASLGARRTHWAPAPSAQCPTYIDHTLEGTISNGGGLMIVSGVVVGERVRTDLRRI